MLKHYRHCQLPATPGRSGKRLLVMAVLVFILAGWDIGGMENSEAAASWFGRVQVIHNASDAGKIDLYVDGRRVWNDADFLTATPYMPLPHGKHTIEIVAGADRDNSRPLLTQTLTVIKDVNYVVVALGLLNPGPGEPAFGLVVRSKTRLETTSVDNLEYFLIHSATCLGKVDMRVLDAVSNNEVIDLLINNISFGETSAYVSLDAWMGHNIEIVTEDGAAQLGVFRLASPAPSGQTLIFALSCRDVNNVKKVTMMGVEIDGSAFFPPIITANEPGAGVALPETVALNGNFPNPFNPSTTIQFDLVQAAEVSVEIVDMLGRRVMTLPAQQIAAGAGRTVAVEATNLASGAYLYHLIARTATETSVKTGWMMLVK